MAEAGQDTELLEDGDIFFLFRPKVDEDEPSGADDVQRFYIALRPRGGHDVRLCVVGRKHMPDVGEHERVWGFVDLVTDDERKIEGALREETYETKTRGERTRPAVRPAGEGAYAVTLEDGQMHLSYELELPEDPGSVQKTFAIAPKASFALSVKNPEKGQPKGAGLQDEDKADYPERLQEKFGDRRFDREDVELLNREGAEFVMVGARRDPEKSYGVDLQAEDEDYESSDTARRMRLVKSRHPAKPLLEGGWG
ncbi:hypothetical protein P6F26_17035 [Roseibacterium sp. SDUM158017]|uniref:hypothetical protein n=1 Tax=Roseicyclus salinarum TaxID=3036773 RepID=UPI0024154439|nr:hypothetical protein [Roseibacterium sp. SDUM158017]MDG4650156.1 hypothetical protein [Roseibacterium sp. SDUM158017]